MDDRERIQDYLKPFDMLDDAVIAVDENQQILYFNPAAERAYALDEASAQRPIQELIQIKEPDMEGTDFVTHVLDTGTWSGVVKHVGAGFTPRWVEWTGNRIELSGLKLRCMVGIARDIGERRAAEEALKSSEQRLRFITDNMFDLVSLTDDRGVIQYASRSHEHTLGYAPHKLVGSNVADLLYNEGNQEAAEWFAQGLGTGVIERNDVCLRHANGKQVWIELIGKVITHSGDAGTQVLFSSRDVSDRNLAKSELSKTEGRYQALFANMTSGVAVFEAVDDGADFVFREFNRAGERATGLSREEVLGQPLTKAFPGMVDMGMVEVLKRVWSTGEPERLQTRRYTDNRLEGWFENHVYRLPSGEVVAVFDDVSAEESAREALRLRDETLRSVFRAAPTGIGMVVDRVMVRVNRLICEMTGRSADELIGQSARLLYPSQEEFEYVGRKKYAQLAEHNIGTVETRWQRADGEIIDVLLSSTPIDADDYSAGVTFTALDITARKQAARQQAVTIQVLELLNRAGNESHLIRDILRILKDYTGCEAVALRLRDKEDYPFFDVSGFSQAHVDAETTLLQRDDDGKPMLDADGRPTLSCLCGLVIRGRMDPELPCCTPGGSFWTSSLSELLASNPPIQALLDSTLNCHSEGYESLALVPLRSEDKVIGLLHIGDRRAQAFPAEAVPFYEKIGSSIGIALERAQAGEQRRDLEHQLQQSQKMEAIGRLAGGVAHDFNNLLTAIGGYCQLLLDGLDAADPMREDVQEIEGAADRATELTKQLLAFSRRQIVAPKVVDPNRIIARSEKMLQRIIGEDVTLEFMRGENVGSMEIDPGQLDQILVNLSVNARDAMPRGGRLILQTSRWSPGVGVEPVQPALRTGDFVRLEVIDTGEGISEEALPYIFEPFFSTKDTGQGTGLGLATVYGIVSQNRGVIEAHSVPGHSTTMTLYFPRIRAAPQTLEEPLQRETMQGKETILLVEDESSLRGLAKKILIRHGYHVLEAANGGEAYLISEQTEAEIDLLLTDVVMPNMNGKQLFTSLHESRPEMRVLYMSGYTDATIAHHGVLERDTEFLQKPFTFESLTRKVRAVLDR